MQLKIGIHGVSGRVGQAVANYLTIPDPRWQLSYSYSRSGANNDLNQLCLDSDVIIDFSSAEALLKLLPFCEKNNTKLVSGTTGVKDRDYQYLQQISAKIPILHSANMSLGANMLILLAARAASHLKNYDIELIETHRKGKQDAPSGTALELKGVLEEEGITTNITSLRMADAAPKHQVIFANGTEELSLTHIAASREVFAAGACQAALWLYNQKAGLYHMRDVLQL